MSIACQCASSVSLSSQPFLISTHDKLHWRRYADLPLAMGSPQSVVIDGKVYVGGGITDDEGDYLVFQNIPGSTRWDILPPCPVRWFALGQFQGHLITVGGLLSSGNYTNKVFRYREEWRLWEEYLTPLPTVRCDLSIASTQSAIIALGGKSKGKNCATVEVYTNKAGQWYAANPLPVRCAGMISVIIADTCYLLGGYNEADLPTESVLCGSVTALIEAAESSSRSSNSWKTLPDARLKSSTVVTLGERLLAVGGFDNKSQDSLAVHMYLPGPTNAWIRMPSSHLPMAQHSATAARLPDNKLLLCGGRDNANRKIATVYIGSVRV